MLKLLRCMDYIFVRVSLIFVFYIVAKERGKQPKNVSSNITDFSIPDHGCSLQ